MNVFTVIFWSCVVADVVVPSVDIKLGWYFLWFVLGMVTFSAKAHFKKSI